MALDIRKVTQRRVDDSLLRSEQSRTLLSAWQDWRGDHLLPRRSAMDMPRIAPLLPHIVILEIDAPDRPMIRLAGTAIGRALGMELTGRNYLDLTEPEIRPLRKARIWRQLQAPCGSLLRNRHMVAGDRVIELEVLTLPVRPDSDDRPPQLLSVITPVSPGVLTMDEAKLQIAKVADDFRYIDIGAGVPLDPALEAPHED